ncbi:CPCC family cysteine-rich protein [Larkinella rosea]|uniref:Cysteine-rich CPCC domain-containing protein n=1 Tax=Larkinella rosea TaxID=2025312 RepID=A0A3P1C8Q0_9BACT|nr:CPCC family cysteine-rich protein [Larkinella rosea]RRB09386.1 hypothetical protein EHT25_00025 [Larkinella rosea]
MTKYTCPCCGYRTMDLGPGHYEICPVCFWEDDPIQKQNPNYDGGANKVSLRAGQQNFINFGACEEDMRVYTRPPNNEELRDVDWRQLN